MMPAVFIELTEFPLRANGKVNRQALPEPSEHIAQQVAFVEAQTDVEKALVAIWREVLNLDKISVKDNFFAIGGHSLLLTQLISRIRSNLGVDVPIRIVFEHPVLQELAAHIDALSSSLSIEQLADEIAAIEALSDDELEALLGQ